MSWNGRHRRDRGQSLVEFALVLTPMLVLFFGIIDFSFIIFAYSVITNSTREAARFATTFNSSYGGSSCAGSQAGCITRVAQDQSFTFLAGSNSSYITVNYYTTNNLSNPVMTCNGGACSQTGTLPQTLSSGKVVTYANQPGNIVEVAVKNLPWIWLAPILGFSTSQKTMVGSSADVLGGLPAGSLQPPNP